MKKPSSAFHAALHGPGDRGCMNTFLTQKLTRSLTSTRTALGVLGAVVAAVLIVLGAQSVTAADRTPNLGPRVEVGSTTQRPGHASGSTTGFTTAFVGVFGRPR
jgi:hypothetical protein